MAKNEKNISGTTESRFELGGDAVEIGLFDSEGIGKVFGIGDATTGTNPDGSKVLVELAKKNHPHDIIINPNELHSVSAESDRVVARTNHFSIIPEHEGSSTGPLGLAFMELPEVEAGDTAKALVSVGGQVKESSSGLPPAAHSHKIITETNGAYTSSVEVNPALYPNGILLSAGGEIRLKSSQTRIVPDASGGDANLYIESLSHYGSSLSSHIEILGFNDGGSTATNANGRVHRTKIFVSDLATFPAQSGNAGKVLQTDGSAVSWQMPASGGSSGWTVISDIGITQLTAAQGYDIAFTGATTAKFVIMPQGMPIGTVLHIATSSATTAYLYATQQELDDENYFEKLGPLNITMGSVTGPEVILYYKGSSEWEKIGTNVAAFLKSSDIKTTLTPVDNITVPSTLLLKSSTSRCVTIQLVGDTTDVDTTSGVMLNFPVPQALNGMNLIRATAHVTTAGTTNATTVQIRNMTKYASNDALSTAISIASGATVGTAGTINTSYDDVSTNDRLKIYVTGQSTTKPKGLYIVLEFQLP